MVKIYWNYDDKYILTFSIMYENFKFEPLLEMLTSCNSIRT